MVNKVFLLGNLGANAETKESDSGNELARFQLATNRHWKDSDGEFQQSTTWHRVVVFGPLVGFARTLTKGQLIHVEGRLETRSYEKDGETRYATQIVAERIQAAGGQPNTNCNGTPAEAS